MAFLSRFCEKKEGLRFVEEFIKGESYAVLRSTFEFSRYVAKAYDNFF